MADLRGNKVHRSLSEKGFVPRNGAKHILYHYWYKGKKTQIFTFMSRPPGPLGDNLIAKMAKQTKLSREEFIELAECPLTKERLLRLYLEREIIY